MNCERCTEGFYRPYGVPPESPAGCIRKPRFQFLKAHRLASIWLLPDCLWASGGQCWLDMFRLILRVWYLVFDFVNFFSLLCFIYCGGGSVCGYNWSVRMNEDSHCGHNCRAMHETWKCSKIFLCTYKKTLCKYGAENLYVCVCVLCVRVYFCVICSKIFLMPNQISFCSCSDQCIKVTLQGFFGIWQLGNRSRDLDYVWPIEWSQSKVSFKPCLVLDRHKWHRWQAPLAPPLVLLLNWALPLFTLL